MLEVVHKAPILYICFLLIIFQFTEMINYSMKLLILIICNAHIIILDKIC